MKQYVYQEIVGALSEQIQKGHYDAGDKLPSIRQLSTHYEVSVNTIKRVFEELEALSLVESRPQSGFYVSQTRYTEVPVPSESKPSLLAHTQKPSDIVRKVYEHIGNEKLTLFSFSALYGDYLPIHKMNKEMQLAMRSLPDSGIAYEPLQGNENLRKNIAQRSRQWHGNLSSEDIVTTSGSMNAIALCMLALGKSGDTIAIESPSYPGIFQLAVALGFKVMELPTHPITGIDIGVLEQMLPKIAMCLLISNYNTPLGSCMPDAHKKRVVALLDRHNIPLIEDDVYGDLYFGKQRPSTCKAYDETGNVLWCSSVSKTLAPGYRVGWVAPGRYKDKILKQKRIHAIATPALMQEAVASFMKSGRYEKHLRKLRQALFANYQLYLATIVAHFPDSIKISRPQGGLSLWIEFGVGFDTLKLYDEAMKMDISIGPGRMFTLQEQFSNGIRICYGIPWSDALNQKLITLGTLAKKVAAGT